MGSFLQVLLAISISLYGFRSHQSCPEDRCQHHKEKNGQPATDPVGGERGSMAFQADFVVRERFL